MNREAFAENEWYHCFSRGIDKRATFKSTVDYERFKQQMILCNTTQAVHRSNLKNVSTEDLLQMQRPDALVVVGAFCLMPNHFHLILRPTKQRSLSLFMQKLMTAYTMYFNIRNERSGGLFVSPFRSKHLVNDTYFQYAIQYVHCNPAELFEPGWKHGNVRNIQKLERQLVTYGHSSFGAFVDEKHHLRRMLDASLFEVATQLSPTEMLEEAREYYEQNPSIKVKP